MLELLPFHAAEQVLKHFRDRFIMEVEADAVVMELLDKDIIPDGVQKRIERLTVQNNKMRSSMLD